MKPDNLDPSAGPLAIKAPVPSKNRLFGLVFAAIPTVGMGFMLVAGAPFAAIAMPLLFILVGMGLAFGQRGAVVDRSAGTLTTWWGLWFPIGRTERPLGAVSHVSIGKEVRGSQKNRITVYPVRVEAAGGEVLAPQDYDAARRAAEQIANYLGTSLHDASSGALVVREAGTLDEPLRDRLRRQGAAPAAPGPAPERFRISAQGDETACVLPPSGVGLMNIISLLISLAFGALVAFFLLDARPPVVVVAVASLMLVGPLLWSIPSLIEALIGRDTVSFSQHGVALKRWGPLRPTRRIPADKLEELVVVGAIDPMRWSLRGSASVWARSDRVTLHLGTNLTAEEASWLQGAISHAVCNSMFGRG